MTIQLEANGRVLRFRGSRMWKRGSEDTDLTEKVYERRFMLGDDIDMDTLSTQFEDEVLKVKVVKKQERRTTTHNGDERSHF